MKEIQNVTIVGAGTMGHSLAQVFAQSGYRVRLNDVQEEILSKARGLIAATGPRCSLASFLRFLVLICSPSSRYRR